MKLSLYNCKFFRDLLKCVQCNVQVNKPSIFEAEDKPVNAELSSAFPGLLHEGSTCHIEDLFFDIDFYQ